MRENGGSLNVSVSNLVVSEDMTSTIPGFQPVRTSFAGKGLRQE